MSQIASVNISVLAKLYPTSSQQDYLARVFGASRFVYNWGLQRKTEQYAATGKSEGYNQTAKALTVMKQEAGKGFLKDAPIVCLQCSLQNLELAYSKFFKKQTRYPKFKSRHDARQSARYVGEAYRLRGNRLCLAKLSGGIKMRLSRELPASPTSCVVARHADGTYWAAFVCDVSPPAVPSTYPGVGLDLGLTDFLVDSRGDRYKLPKQTKCRARLKRLQRSMYRKQKGSKNRAKARVLVARAYSRIQNVKTDFLHKLSKQIVVENQDIAMEDLAVKNMVKNRCLSRAIGESSWREFRTMIDYKSRLYGRNLVVIDRFFPSSKTCHGCGHVVSKLPLDVREWSCPRCGSAHDRDINAAINILAASYVVSACGADGRPTKNYVRSGRSAKKQESNN